MTVITYCATGCTMRGQHAAQCPERCRHAAPPRPGSPRPCPPRVCDGSCPGCAPRLAEVGRLCAWCAQRLTADVAAAPALVRQLREEIGAASSAPDAGVRGRGDPALRSILSAAVGAADEIHVLLAHYARLILEEHPNGRRMTGPDETGTHRSMTTLAEYQGQTYLRRSTIAGLAHHLGSRTQNGKHPGVSVHEAIAPVLDADDEPIRYLITVRRADVPRVADPTSRLVQWLMPWLPWCAEQKWAGVMRQEIGSLIATTTARWPTEDYDERPVPGVECPRCQQLGLTYTPPRWATAPFKVACSNPECGRVFSEDEWTRLVGLLEIAERRHHR